MITAPMGYLSPAHLSDKDRVLANFFKEERDSISYVRDAPVIGFSFLSLDLVVMLEAVENRAHLLEQLGLLREAGFSYELCKILHDAFMDELIYVLFHENAPEDPRYPILSDEYHVLEHS